MSYVVIDSVSLAAFLAYVKDCIGKSTVVGVTLFGIVFGVGLISYIVHRFAD